MWLMASYLPKSMVLSFHVNQCCGINRIAQAPQQLDIDYRAIQKSFAALQPPLLQQTTTKIEYQRLSCSISCNLIFSHIYFPSQMDIENTCANYNTCGYRSKSNCKWPAVGRGDGSSYPVHISKSKCPKQIISMLSTSAILFAQTTAFTFEFKPNKPFSNPDNLMHETNVC